MRVWEPFLTEQDRAVFAAAGYGRPAGFGGLPAVLVIDVNYAFCGDRPEPILESIRTWRNSCGEAAWRALPRIQTLLQSARAARVPTFFTTGFDRRPDGFDAGGWARKSSRESEDGRPRAPGPAGGNDIMAEIAPWPSDVVVRKLKPSAFHGTGLLGFLVDLGVDTLLVCGTTTSGCVRASVVDAFSYNFKVSVVEECTFDRGEASHALSLFDMNAKYADVVSLADAVDYLGGVAPGLYDARIDFAAAAAAAPA